MGLKEGVAIVDKAYIIGAIMASGGQFFGPGGGWGIAHGEGLHLRSSYGYLDWRSPG